MSTIAPLAAQADAARRRGVFAVAVELLDLVDDGAAGLRRQRSDLALELRDAVGTPATKPHDHDDDGGQEDDDGDGNDGSGHDAVPAVRIGVAPVPHPRPSRQVSCFQIGTEALSASMANRAASNASAR